MKSSFNNNSNNKNWRIHSSCTYVILKIFRMLVTVCFLLCLWQFVFALIPSIFLTFYYKHQLFQHFLKYMCPYDTSQIQPLCQFHFSIISCYMYEETIFYFLYLTLIMYPIHWMEDWNFLCFFYHQCFLFNHIPTTVCTHLDRSEYFSCFRFHFTTSNLTVNRIYVIIIPFL